MLLTRTEQRSCWQWSRRSTVVMTEMGTLQMIEPTTSES